MDLYSPDAPTRPASLLSLDQMPLLAEAIDALKLKIGLTPPGKYPLVSTEVARQVEATQQRLDENKAEFFLSLLLLNQVELEGAANPKLAQLLSYSRCASLLQSQPLLGLSSSVMEDARAKHTEVHPQPLLVSRLESRLASLLLSLDELCEHQDEDTGVIQCALRLRGDQEALREAVHQQSGALREHASLAREVAERLSQLIVSHKYGHVLDSQQLRAKWLGARVDAMAAKLEVIRFRLLLETYSADNVRALDKIRRHLEEARRQSVERREVAAGKLAQYEQEGEPLRQLAEQMKQIKAQQEELQWSIDQLQQ